ncbi:PAS domain-containing protein [Halopseudomonas salegens]|uniref:PAS domain S-box-containing protein n=1 Tax=Halopseudomonas salegens TaxID=1434072 RepID=A0A1H2GU02_9GAMM|nr:PAS domain-containing protein [Halopseudomonas salegens]SDU22962.1 PAS domain S-box-containing protein [Halopseudomonas salegens]
MTTPLEQSNVYRQLRHKAETQLQTGTTLATGDWSVGVDALSLLHRLSSAPESAEDALKLLHELQVHQVELDLQNEELAANEQGLVDEVQLYQDLFEAAPFGYFLIDLEGRIIQASSVAAELLDVAHEELAGRTIDSFLRAKSRPQLLDLLQQVGLSGTRDSCLAETSRGLEGSRRLHCLASTRPGHRQILLACCESIQLEQPH